MTTFCCNSKGRFLETRRDIDNHLVHHGYAVIEAWDATPSTLKEISGHFGRVQLHIRADASGVVGISTEAPVNSEWMDYRSEYIGVSSDEFMPHTDGTFLHGLVNQGNEYVELFPPKMLVLQCVQNAAAGGGNLLIDGQRIYRDLAKEHPQYLEVLSKKGCVAFCRDDQMALDCAVFETLDDGQIMLRFRYDAAAFVATWALEAYHALQRDYFANPRYQSHLTLTTRQVLLVDNYRMLHGRSAFSNGDETHTRSLHRLWLARDHLPVLRNVLDEHRENRALKRYQAYGVLPASDAFQSGSSLPLGIRKSVLKTVDHGAAPRPTRVAPPSAAATRHFDELTAAA